MGFDTEALELGPRGGTPGAELDPPVRDQIEDGHRFGGANGMVVGLGEKPHAVTDAELLGL